VIEFLLKTRQNKKSYLILQPSSTILTSEYEMDFSSWFASAIIVSKIIKRPEEGYINLYCRENLDPFIFKTRIIFSIIDYIIVNNKRAKTRTVFRLIYFNNSTGKKISNLIWDKYCECLYEVNLL
jgi:hypothetical protein